jgi:tetratricopeptide (TPR) repeat protein
MQAEVAYLFQHALVRDAAYELQPPGERAGLHELAAGVLELLPGAEGALAGEIARHLAQARGETGQRGLLEREERFTRLAALHAEAHYNFPEAQGLWQRLARIAPEGWRADAMRAAGRAAVQYGGAEAEALLREGLELARAEKSEKSEAHICGSLGNLYQQTGRVEESREYHERAVELARRMGARELEGVQVGNIANLYFRQGRLEEAQATHLQALEIHRETGNRKNEGVALSNLAGVMQKLERASEAEALFRDAIELLHQEHELRSHGIAMANYGNFLADAGRLDEAEAVLTQALGLVRESGNRRFEGNVLGSLGMLFGMTGRRGEAVECLARAVAIHREVQNVEREIFHGLQYALAMLRTGETAAARAKWREYAGKAQQYNRPALLAEMYEEMRQACEAAGIEAFE